MDRLIEYYVTDEQINVFVLGTDIPENPIVIQIKYDYFSLGRLVWEFRSSVLSVKNVNELAAELYQVLVQPLVNRSAIRSGDRLYIAPHRCLHYIPFQALGLDPSYPLLSTNPVAYILNGATIPLFLNDRPSNKKSLVIKKSAKHDSLALKQSFQREQEIVSSLIGGEVLCDESASLPQIEAAIAGKSWIHFTCHGVFSPERPEDSGLLISGKDGRDKLLEINGIINLPLQNVDMVVLAACDSGLSEPHPGDESIGLVRAFTLAGVQSVVSTLWPVHSFSTEVFVTSFYHHLLEGKTKIDSLQHAQLDVWRTELDKVPQPEKRTLMVGQKMSLNKNNSSSLPYSHPYYWAPFTLHGAWR